MRITIWVTEHPYAQRIAMALKLGFKDDAVLAMPQLATDETLHATDVHICYGIMRGMDAIYKRLTDAGKHWFNIDLGYFGAQHFDGQYRIAYKGTQNLFDKNIQSIGAPEFLPWRTGGDDALICPPTEYVAGFFGVDEKQWLEHAAAQAVQFGLNAKIRRKDDPEKLDDALAKAGLVITYNSSVGWKALQQGIPCISDIHNSTVGSWHSDVKTLDDIKQHDRAALFSFMMANQLSLLDIQQGKLLPMLKRYLPTP